MGKENAVPRMESKSKYPRHLSHSLEDKWVVTVLHILRLWEGPPCSQIVSDSETGEKGSDLEQVVPGEENVKHKSSGMRITHGDSLQTQRWPC